MATGESYGTSDEDGYIATIHRAPSLVIDFLDTADTYGPFANGRLVGKAIAGRRYRVVLAPRFVNERRKYLEENTGTVDVTLADEDLRRIEKAVPRGPTAGERYAGQQVRSVDR